MAYSGLETALSSTLEHRTICAITPVRSTGFILAKCSQWINVTLGCALHVSYHFYLNRKHRYRWYLIVKLKAHNYQRTSIKINYQKCYISMTQPRFRRAQPRLIFIHCLYWAKINPVLRISAIAQMVERRNDDLEIAEQCCSSPFHATIILPTTFACLHTFLQAETHN